ncbi:hypothetical protein GF373_07695 [bacterium]|nr:hypothetical protein [bacterium]
MFLFNKFFIQSFPQHTNDSPSVLRYPCLAFFVLFSLFLMPSNLSFSQQPPPPNAIGGVAGGGVSETLTKGSNEFQYDNLDPISMGTGEYYFIKDVLSLNGAFPFNFKLYYGSQVDSKREHDGFPGKFIGSHHAVLTRYAFGPSQEIFVELGAKEIGFVPGLDGWVCPNERIRYRLKERHDGYYLMDPERSLVYTFQAVGEPVEPPIVLHDIASVDSNEQSSIGLLRGSMVKGAQLIDISANGRFVAFSSLSGQYVEGDNNETWDVFLRDRWGEGETYRVTMGYKGDESNDESGEELALSADGSCVAFQSDASNLVPNDTNEEKTDVFVYDSKKGEIELISVNLDGVTDYRCREASISADGRYVVFRTRGVSYIPDNEKYNIDDVFLRDRETQTTIKVSVNSQGEHGNDSSYQGQISDNGRFIAFRSKATNLVPNDTNDETDIFVHDVETGETTRVSVSSEGNEGNGKSNNARISADGRFIVFESTSNNLVPGDENEKSDVFVHDRANQTTQRVSYTSEGEEPSEDCFDPDISPDGRYIAFVTEAPLVPEDVNECEDVYLYDQVTKKIVRASVGIHGGASPYMSEFPALSGGAAFIAFIAEQKFYAEGPDEELYISARRAPEKAVLTKIEDRNGNSMHFEYSGEGEELLAQGPTRIHDGHGSELRCTYEPFGADDTPYLTKVEDQAGRSCTFAYEDSPVDNPDAVVLRSFTDPEGNTIEYAYDGGQRIVSQTLPLGNTPYTQTYDPESPNRGIVTTQTDAYGNVTTITKEQYEPYSGEDTHFSITYPDETTQSFAHAHGGRIVSSVTDQRGNTATFQPDESADRLTGFTDRMGDTTRMDYHPSSGQITSSTNTAGNNESVDYTKQIQTFTNPTYDDTVSFAFHLPAIHHYPNGTTQRYEYDSRGNVIKSIDAMGNEWTYTYNNQGQILTVTNPEGGVITNTYNDDTTLASRKDSDTGETAYEYDQFKRLTRIQHPDESTFTLTYDLNDRVTSRTDENGNTYTYSYDANGNLTTITNPENQITQYAYNLMDKITEITDKRGKTTTYTYDTMGRTESVTNPDGVTTSYGYDARGWRTRVSQGDKTWTTAYDDEGVVTASTSPMGQSTTHQNDKLGHLVQVTDPLNAATTLSRDSIGQVTEITNPLGRTLSYGYNENGQLIHVNTPNGSSTNYIRNNLGLYEVITDLNGNTWNFSYTDMGRLTQMVDPLGNTSTFTYDNRGRLALTTFADDAALAYTYDNTGNVIQKTYADGTDQQFSYDNLNRLAGVNGLALTRDVDGRVTNTENQDANFGATYDDSGRLKTVTYNDVFTVTYEYNPETGQLTQISDNLGTTRIGLNYDNNGNLINITRSNGIDTTRSFDAANQLTRIQHGEVIDVQYSLNSVGEIVVTNAKLPIDVAAFLEPETNERGFNAASQINSDDYVYDSRGRLTSTPETTYEWNDASRLIGINNISLAYNGLGDLTSRTQEGKTTLYGYNYALAMHPIVAEKDSETGQFIRYYVWTPDGRLLYMIDASAGNEVYFYHFDQIGSTLALTDASGTLTDSYAYTPFGELLTHNGDNQQPFMYIGEWGVRQETPTLYQMRARYYNAKTARFLSKEPIWPEIAEPTAINPYQYAYNNPISYKDPTGLYVGRDYMYVDDPWRELMKSIDLSDMPTKFMVNNDMFISDEEKRSFLVNFFFENQDKYKDLAPLFNLALKELRKKNLQELRKINRPQPRLKSYRETADKVEPLSTLDKIRLGIHIKQRRDDDKIEVPFDNMKLETYGILADQIGYLGEFSLYMRVAARGDGHMWRSLHGIDIQE